MSENVEKCPKNAQEVSGGAQNTIFGHFSDNFAYLADAFVWWPCPMLAVTTLVDLCLSLSLRLPVLCSLISAWCFHNLLALLSLYISLSLSFFSFWVFFPSPFAFSTPPFLSPPWFFSFVSSLCLVWAELPGSLSLWVWTFPLAVCLSFWMWVLSCR